MPLHAYFKTWPEVPPHEVIAIRAIRLSAHGAVPIFLFISGFLPHVSRGRPSATLHDTNCGGFSSPASVGSRWNG